MLGFRCWSLVRDTTSDDWDLIPPHGNLLSSLCAGPLGFSSLPLWVSRSFFYVVPQLHVPECKLGSCQRDVKWESLDSSLPSLGDGVHTRDACHRKQGLSTGNIVVTAVTSLPPLQILLSITKTILLILLTCVLACACIHATAPIRRSEEFSFHHMTPGI